MDLSPELVSIKFDSASLALRSATPPPTTTPSAIAALVALRASSTRAFFSFISVSVAAPILRTATPPVIFPILFCIFSLSHLDFESFSWLLNISVRSVIRSLFPSPPTKVVLFLAIMTFSAPPKDVGPCDLMSALLSFARTEAPVNVAMSSRSSPCSSPKPGALIAAALTTLLATFNTNVASASPSTSLAIISSGLFCCMLASRLGSRSWALFTV